MDKKTIFLILFLCTAIGCATVVVKSGRYFPRGVGPEDVLVEMGQPQHKRTIADDSGDVYEIYRYKADDFFDSYNPTPFYNENSVQSVPTDIVFKNGTLILQGVRIQGKFFEMGEAVEQEMLRSIDWHLQQSEKKLRTSLFW